jgi:restriction system protein
MATKHDLPNYSEYFQPTIVALKARGGSATIEELEQDVSEALQLSDEILAVPHGDSARSQFQYELAWVRTYLKKIGAVENSERGVWSLTPVGAAMSEAELRDVPRRVRAETRRVRQAVEELGDSEEPIESEGSSEEAEIFWKERLTDALLSIVGAFILPSP